MSTTTFPTEDVLVRSLLRNWWPVALVDEVERGPQEVQLLEHPLVVYRGEGGEFFVADAQCPHRGASLGLGTVAGDTIACPYHGWHWDGKSGACTRIPALGSDQRRIPGNARLRTYRTLVRMGLVWTCLDERAPENVPDPPELDVHDWKYATAISEQGTNVLFSMENFRDVAHFPFVHQETFGIPVETEFSELDVSRDGREVRMTFHFGSDAEDPSAAYDTDGATVYYHAWAPGFVLGHAIPDKGVGDWLLIHAACPVSLEETRAFRVMGIAPDFGGTLEALVETEDAVYAEDAVIAETLRPRRLGVAFDQVHTLADAYTLKTRAAFMDWVTEQEGQLSTNGAGPTAVATGGGEAGP